ncbi:ATP-binding protein [Catellatospora sichuanensis]|uniref:ATP-binding protein n=1 Tax=Catellatospora sichuanensis TaxID=1969805 RepID=UPI0011841A23|nr:ATP-binding protein [Catellatospora sichuanensis]
MLQAPEPFRPPPPYAASATFAGPDDLSAVRQFAGAAARAAGLAPARAAALEVAVSELATNTLRHTPSGGTIRVWPESGSVVCEVVDTGTFVPANPPAAAREGGGGWGLKIAAEVADGFYLHSEPGRSRWRLLFRL